MTRPDAAVEEIRAACEAASALEFIDRLPQGLETRLGRHATNLSAGEIHRIAIARAILTRPRILLLDEPTAALDAASEARLVDSLLTLRPRMTIVVVAHRDAAIRRADRVISLDGGTVAAAGPCEDLPPSPSSNGIPVTRGARVDAGAQ
jgi:ABC-type multidrug transport system fused ATPase/permease subunit